jgi:malate dehydrogenase (oxaloacetate-decarboxylating)(NADP+)
MRGDHEGRGPRLSRDRAARQDQGRSNQANATQEDLSLAYSPGVAEPVREIAKDPETSFRYTARGNLVGVISNGTAILGLGNSARSPRKPVMEGKGVLFKRFADIDVFDIEVGTEDPTSSSMRAS